jgi:hypothetical protein
MSTLGERQAAVVAALVAGAPAPFDPDRVRATAAALLRKRAGEVAAAWPMLAASLGRDWQRAFAAWAAGRPPAGALRDGWDFARTFIDPGFARGPEVRRCGGTVAPLAAEELAVRDALWVYDGTRAPRRRRLPAVRRCRGIVIIQIGGRVRRIDHRGPRT